MKSKIISIFITHMHSYDKCDEPQSYTHCIPSVSKKLTSIAKSMGILLCDEYKKQYIMYHQQSDLII